MYRAFNYGHIQEVQFVSVHFGTSNSMIEAIWYGYSTITNLHDDILSRSQQRSKGESCKAADSCCRWLQEFLDMPKGFEVSHFQSLLDAISLLQL